MRKYAVTKEKLEAEIANVKYTMVGATTMLCSIVLVNGFVVPGHCSYIEPNIFDEADSKDIAYQNALNQLAFLICYQEKQRWFRETQQSKREKLAAELANLDQKRSELVAFMGKGKPYDMSNEEWELLRQQDEIMGAYGLILQERLVMMKRSKGV